MAVYFYYGDEDFNIDTEIANMRSSLNPDFISMSYRQYENPEYQTLISALRTPPMMFGNMLTMINAEGYFSGNKNWFEDNELTEIEMALNDVPETSDIVFVVKYPRNEGKKPDSRRKLFKILSKFKTKEFSTIPTYKTAEIAGWVKNRAKSKGLTIKEDALELFMEQIGNDLRQYDNELEKLKLACYPEKTVTKKMISEVCISNQDLFNLTNYLMQNQNDKALLEFKKLTDKRHPLEILSAVQTMLRQWIIVKTKTSVPEIMKIAGIRNEYRIANLKKDLKNTPVKDLVKLRENLFNVEYRIKSGEVTDIESEVEYAIIR